MAPFHRDKNSFNDALIIEAYADCVKERIKPRDRFAFVTHNHRDFSDPTGNQKLPHSGFCGALLERANPGTASTLATH